MIRALLPALACALAVAGAAAAGEPRPTLADLEDEIMCPVCATTLDQSNAPVARQMKMFITARIAAGDSKGEIKDKLVDQFGEEVLAAPPKEGFNLLAWLLPLGGVALAVPLVGWAAWRWSRTRAREPVDVPVDAGFERRIDEELAAFER